MDQTIYTFVIDDMTIEQLKHIVENAKSGDHMTYKMTQEGPGWWLVRIQYPEKVD